MLEFLNPNLGRHEKSEGNNPKQPCGYDDDNYHCDLRSPRCVGGTATDSIPRIASLLLALTEVGVNLGLS